MFNDSVYVESMYYISCLINAFSTSKCIHEIFTTSFVINNFEITMVNVITVITMLNTKHGLCHNARHDYPCGLTIKGYEEFEELLASSFTATPHITKC